MYGPFKMICWPILQTKKLPNTFGIDKIEKSYQLGKMYFYKKILMKSTKYSTCVCTSNFQLGESFLHNRQ